MLEFPSWKYYMGATDLTARLSWRETEEGKERGVITDSRSVSLRNFLKQFFSPYQK